MMIGKAAVGFCFMFNEISLLGSKRVSFNLIEWYEMELCWVGLNYLQILKLFMSMVFWFCGLLALRGIWLVLCSSPRGIC